MSSALAIDPEKQLRETIASLAHDPLGYVIFNFPWGRGELADEPGPRDWQTEFLDDLGKRLRAAPVANAVTMVVEAIIRLSTSSGHGIGKSCLVAWLIKWALDTRVDTRGVATANTATQLETKTWPELKKWHRLSLTSHWFKCTATAIYSADPAHEKTWRVDATPWSEHNTEAFAGLHNKGKRIILIYDEASAIADKVWEVSDGALTDEGTEIIWAAFGNPTRATGRFRETSRRDRARWKHREIDSRTVEGTNKAYLDEFVEANGGEDSDIVKIRVRGVFPSQSISQFISETDVDEASKRHYRPHQYDFAPKIISLDPAWTGGDELVFGMRQGLVFQILGTMPRNDNDVVVAQRLAKYEIDHKADGVFIDQGYGQGIWSLGKTWGLKWQLVHFGTKLPLASGLLNERVRIWAAMKQWLKDGGAIPDDPVLKQDLTSVETLPRADGVLALESKDAMKKRGLPSPNRADALAITFAFDIRPKGDAARASQNVSHGQTNRRRA